MRILKKILVGIISLIALLLIIALFVPKNYIISESIVINKTHEEVFNYVSLLKNQEQYSEWVKADPTMQPLITGNDGEIGAIQSWNSKNDNVGEGSQKIIYISQDSILVDLNFIRPFKGAAKAATIIKPVSANETQLISKFYANDQYPFNLMGYFIGRKMITEVEIKNLNNIKTILEKQ